MYYGYGYYQLFIPTVVNDQYFEDTKNLPRDDELMTYLKEEHRYILTSDYVKSKLNIELDTLLTNATEARVFLDEISEITYDVLFSEIGHNNFNQEVEEFKISKTEEGRSTIKRAMISMVKYAVRSGGTLLGDQHGVDIKTGNVIDIERLRTTSVMVSGQAKRIFKNAGLMFTGEYTYRVHPDAYRVDY